MRRFIFTKREIIRDLPGLCWSHCNKHVSDLNQYEILAVKDNSSYGHNTLGPLCLWNLFVDFVHQVVSLAWLQFWPPGASQADLYKATFFNLWGFPRPQRVKVMPALKGKRMSLEFLQFSHKYQHSLCNEWIGSWSGDEQFCKTDSLTFCLLFPIDFYLLLLWLNIFHLGECILRLNLDWPEILAWSIKRKM